MLKARQHAAIVAVLGALSVFGCSDTPVAPSETDQLELLAARATTSFVDVIARAGGVVGAGPVVGTSKLTRNDNGLQVRTQTSELTPGNVYTAWIKLTGMNPGPFLLDSKVAGGSGKATFAGSFKTPDAQTLGAQIIIRSHGPKVPGTDQTSSVGAGCNPCASEQDAIHPAVP